MNFNEQKKEDTQKVSLETSYFDEKVVNRCPSCNKVNESEALYCEECGHELSKIKTCPSCKSKVTEDADICEGCGEWLLDHRCKFCYAELEENQKYCGECGNPSAGIVCQKCGETSFFDFCKECNVPLTDDAKSMVANLKSDPEYERIREFIEGDSSEEVKVDEGSSSREELEILQNYLSKSEKRNVERKSASLFSEDHKKAIEEMSHKADDEIRRREAKKKRLEEEKIQMMKKKMLEKREYYENTASKTFKNNQEARKFHDTIKPRGTRGWLCNFTSTIHSCPAGCCEPWHGGYWLV